MGLPVCLLGNEGVAAGDRPHHIPSDRRLRPHQQPDPDLPRLHQRKNTRKTLKQFLKTSRRLKKHHHQLAIIERECLHPLRDAAAGKVARRALVSCI